MADEILHDKRLSCSSTSAPPRLRVNRSLSGTRQEGFHAETRRRGEKRVRLQTKPILRRPAMRRLLAFASLCLLSTSAFAIEPPREKERWTTLAIDELTVYSSADDYTTRSVASDLVRLRNALGVVTQLKVRSPLPTRVFIFGDRRSFEQYSQAAIGRSENLSGVF